MVGHYFKVLTNHVQASFCSIHNSNAIANCEVEPLSWRGLLDTTLCDKVCQWLATGRWFSPGTSISTTNKTDLHDITEILLKVAFKHHQPKPNAITLIHTTKVNGLPAVPE